MENHTSDAAEVRERMDFITHESQTQTTAEQIEGTICALTLTRVILRDYVGHPELADTVTVMRDMLREAYVLGYRWVIDGRDPQRGQREMMGVSQYLTKFRNYRDLSPSERLEPLWEDIGVMHHCAICTFEDMQSQKYRSYGADCAVLSTLGILYGFKTAYDSLTPSILKIIEASRPLEALDEKGNIRVKEYLENTELPEHVKKGINTLTHVPDPTLEHLLGDGKAYFLHDIALRTNMSQNEARIQLRNMTRDGKVEELTSSDGKVLYKLIK